MSLDRKPPLPNQGWKNEAERQVELRGSILGAKASHYHRWNAIESNAFAKSCRDGSRFGPRLLDLENTLGVTVLGSAGAGRAWVVKSLIQRSQSQGPPPLSLFPLAHAFESAWLLDERGQACFASCSRMFVRHGHRFV